MGASGALRAKLDLLMPPYLSAVRRIWTDDPAGRYPDYLVMLHTIMRATEPLLLAGLAEARTRAAADPVAAALVPYYTKHVREEHGHDEWLREDLAAIGRDPDEPRRVLPGAAVAAAVGAQYYWLRHHHPCCLLGYIAVVEGYPPAPAWVAALPGALGYPAAGFRTLRRHAALDIGHRDDLDALLDALPLDPAHQAAIGLSGLHTIRAMTTVVEQLVG